VNEWTEKYVRRKPHQREISTVKCRTNQEKIEMQSGKKNKKTGLQQGVFNPLAADDLSCVLYGCIADRGK